MGRIKKSPGSKHDASLSPFLIEYNRRAYETPLYRLPEVLLDFPSHWPFPRGDLYHWLHLLNRFDDILHNFIERYQLDQGPQTIPFGRGMLVEETKKWLQQQNSDSGEPVSTADVETFLADVGWGPDEESEKQDADRLIVESILEFSRLLMEKCGNRSLYNSSELINDLINTTDLSLLQVTLRLGAHLAQRYYMRQRVTGNSFHHSLLVAHYNVELDKVQKITMAFPRPPTTGNGNGNGNDNKPSVFAKDKSAPTPGGSGRKKSESPKINANDVLTLFGGQYEGSSDWQEWGNVHMTYFLPEDQVSSRKRPLALLQAQIQQEISPSQQRTLPYFDNNDPQPPNTPSPLSRQTGSRLTRAATSAGTSAPTGAPATIQTDNPVPAPGAAAAPATAPATTPTAPRHPLAGMSNSGAIDPLTSITAQVEDDSHQFVRTLDICAEEVIHTPINELVQKYIDQVPPESRYELLHRIRIAKALSSEHTSARRSLFAIRALAINNLAYVYPEPMFNQRIFFLDADEPKRLQFTYQLAELVHLAVTGDLRVDIVYATIACNVIEALAKHRPRSGDVCASLNVNVGHGVLMFVAKKMVEEVADDTDSWADESSTRVRRELIDDYRDAVFAVLRILPSAGIRTADSLVSAGLLYQFVDILNLRTEKAKRMWPRTFEYIDHLVHIVREGLSSFVNAKGFDATASVLSYLTTTGYEAVKAGKGYPQELTSSIIDYQVPYFHQQSLKWLLKLISHVMGSHMGHHERVIRNFVDDPRVLAALKLIIENPHIFGAQIYTNVVNTISTFINNEPTSYSVVAEAGLPKALLETIMDSPFVVDEAALGTGANANGQESPPPTALGLKPNFSIRKGKPETLEELKEKLDIDPNRKPAGLVLPHGDLMLAIPTVFSAICLNTSGLRLFQQSDALERFFGIFESPEHIKAMKQDRNIVKTLGSLVDEFARHQPVLKESICGAVELMVARVLLRCRIMAWKGRGAKLWKKVKKSKGELHNGQPLPEDVAFIEVAGEQDLFVDSLPSDTLYEKAVKEIVEQHVRKPFDPKEHLNEQDVDEETGLTVSDYITCTMRFLRSFFENRTLCAYFMSEHGGAGLIIDFATLASLPGDIHNHHINTDLAVVIHSLCDCTPQLILPRLILDLQKVVDSLEPFWNGENRLPGKGFFHPVTCPAFTEEEESKKDALQQPAPVESGDQSLSQPEPMEGVEMTDPVPSDSPSVKTEHVISHSTFYTKQLVKAAILADILTEVFSSVGYNHRQHAVCPFHVVNLADLYEKLVDSLGKLRSACMWEEILLMKDLPDSWKESTKMDGGLVPAELTPPATSQAPESQGQQPQQQGEGQPQGAQPSSAPQPAQPSSQATAPAAAPAAAPAVAQPQAQDQPSEEALPFFGYSTDDPKNNAPQPVESSVPGGVSPGSRRAHYLNVKTLRYLLANVPIAITRFMRGLGNGIGVKRRLDIFTRQRGTQVADAIARTYYRELNFETPYGDQGGDSESEKGDRTMYLVVVLSSLQLLLFDTTSDQPQAHCLTLILDSFKRMGGIQAMKKLADWFTSELLTLTEVIKKNRNDGSSLGRLASLFGAVKVVVTFFSLVVSYDTIVESNQTKAMVYYERDAMHGDHFNANQFLVELRHEVLGQVLEMWNSRFVEVANTSIVASLVSTLEAVLGDSAQEAGAARRSDTRTPRLPSPPKRFTVDPVRLNNLKTRGYAEDLAIEALYRCKNEDTPSLLYCAAHQGYKPPPRIPPQTEEVATSTATPAAENPFGPAPAPGVDRFGEFLAQVAPGGILSGGQQAAPPDFSQLRALLIPGAARDTSTSDEHPSSETDGDRTPNAAEQNQATLAAAHRARITIEDLDELRDKIRSNLIERCVEVLDKHHDLTIPLARVIHAASTTLSNSYSFHRDVIGTLIPSLISLQMEENFRKHATKISAYANLLGRLLENDQLYQHTIEDLKENFLPLVDFIKIPPSTDSTPNSSETAYPYIGQVLMVLESIMADDEKPTSLEVIHANDDLTLPDAYNVEPARQEAIIPFDHKVKLFNAILEILPRIGKSQSLALSVSRMLVILTRHRSISARLGERKNLQRLFVMMKQVACASEKKLQCTFMLILRHIVEDEETVRQIITSEVTSFLNNRSIRQSELNHMIRHLAHSVIRSPDDFVDIVDQKAKMTRYDPRSQRPLIMLKETPQETTAESSDNAQAQSPQRASGDAPATGIPKEKNKLSELKTPVVEHPDGVIHYMLSELLSYRDVEDKETPTEPPVQPAQQPSTAQTSTASSSSQPGSTDQSQSTQANSQANRPATATGRTPFKPDDHPIFIYRCFLLQCLTELLSSYNRTKIEFISFSRKADPFASTPSKPRSGILNYLLNSLIPIGTMTHDDSIPFKKRLNTSACAARVVVALCQQTSETGPVATSKEREQKDLASGLVFVRKFVLEHAIRAFKDAQISHESLDAKYARLLSLADLFDKMLAGNTLEDMSSSADDIAKMMFEKNFISVLTSSIAEMDLDFPLAKRAVKYILRPLKKLTSTAVFLSENAEISTILNQDDEDEISSATSVSSFDDDREETPDLFRHSTLGMFEHNQDEETSSEEGSEEEDDEMYDDEIYADEMEYDDDMEEDDNDEVVSDDDEDEEGHGPMEGLPGDFPMDVEVLLDDDDDDDDDDDEEDDEEGDSEMEDDEIVAGEITGDNDNDSLQGGAEDEWESEDMSDEDEEGEEVMMEQFENDLDDYVQGEGHGTRHFNSLLRILDGHDHVDDPDGDQFDQDEEDDEGMDEDDDDDEMDEDDVDENENIIEDIVEDMEMARDNEDDGDDDGVVYEGFEDMPGEWMNMDGPHTIHDRMTGLLHRSRATRMPTSPWNILPPSAHGRAPFAAISGIRSHGTYSSGRAMDGRNHLLDPAPGANAPANDQQPNTDSISDWVHAMGAGNSHVLSVDSPVAFLNAIIEAVSAGGPGLGVVSRPDGVAVHLNPDNIPPRVQQLFNLHRGHPIHTSSVQTNDPTSAVTFASTPTALRWQEEASILFGDRVSTVAARVTGAVVRALVPAAAVEERERRRIAAEEQARREEAERREREKREREEAEIQRQREEEEARERRRREEEERAAAEERARYAAEHPEDVMQVDEGETQPAQTEPPEPVQRIYTTIRGQRTDITGLNIDLEYIEALPEELREEVIIQQVSEQRINQATTRAPSTTEPVSIGDQTGISAEFLNALPDEIREELLQAEAADRLRRARESVRREAAERANTAQPPTTTTNAPAVVTTLEPTLRSVSFPENPFSIVEGHGRGLVTESSRRGQTVADFLDAHALGDRNENQQNNQGPAQQTESEERRAQRRQIVQMIDRGGVCTLARLMYTPMAGKTRNLINEILNSVCQNRTTRFEVLSILLLILREGSQGVAMLEKSYNQLSARAKSIILPTRVANANRKLSLPMGSSGEVTPLLVIQQCLTTLSYLTQYNAHISWFFLTEHDIFSLLKAKKQTKVRPPGSEFAVNSLLSLLDKSLIMDSPTCLEQLATILSGVTQPLTLLAKRERERTGPAAAQAAESAQQTVPSVETQQAESSTQAQNTASGSGPQGQGEAREEESRQRRQHMPPPPFIPDNNLRAIVNVLSAPECNGKTFRDTLSTITNLSSMPGAKQTIGNQLIANSKALCISVTRSLINFMPSIPSAETGTDIQGLALSMFNPASSDQAKLLRALTALDYLFNPTRSENARREREEVEHGEKLLKSLYESPEFGPMWVALSNVLTQIRNKTDMVNIAKMMLPLIESLMVVCKNTTLREPIMSRASRDTSVTTPPPESPLEALFFKFTEEHRKILNELVRANPKLMSGSFSLLVRNPKVLEFDNKRNYFNRKLHYRADSRKTYPPLQLSVRRDRVFHDSFRSLYYKSPNEVKYGKLNIKFHGEEGIDAGGVAREWFHVLARSMFNPDFALFIPVASDRTTFHPNRLSGINEEHLAFFKFIGRIISKALYENRVLDCHFSRAVYKRILGKDVSIKDMETLDLDYYKSLQWMLENDITDIITETFSVEADSFGETQIIDLIPNGRNIPVTQENKEEYVQKVVNYRLVGSVEEQLDNFLKGFHEIVPRELISIFNEQELELLISGLPEIDIDDWKANTDYHNYTSTSPTIQWFWRAVRSFDKEERAKLLQFVTGTSKVPLNGFKELEGMNGFTKFNIHRDYGSKDRLPSSHTCFNQLDLPEYDTYEDLRQRLYTAMTTGSGYFGFA